MSFRPLQRLRARFAGNESFRVVERLFLADGVKHWKGYAVAFAFMALMGLSTAGMAWMMRDAVNSIFVTPTFWGIWAVALAVMGLSAVKGISAYGQTVAMARVGNRVVADNQKRAFEHLLGQEISFFAARHTAEISSRLQAGAAAARNALNLVITSIGRDLFTLLALAMVAIIQDPTLAFVALVVMPIAVIGTRKLIKKAKTTFRRQFTSSVQLSSISLEAIQGMRTVKAYGLEDNMRTRVQAYVDDVERSANSLARTQAKSSPLMETLGGFAIGGVILYAGYNVMFVGKSPGEFFSVLTALLLAYEPAKRLARFNVELTAHLVGAQMLFELLDMRAPESEEKNLPDLPAGPGRVTFENVEFGYRPGEQVLRGFDLVAEPGQTTALVGPSGGGKTTVINLIERFFSHSGGIIAIDGHDVTAHNRPSVRARAALVSQDVYLFSGTIRENIGFGREGASEDDIIAAAKSAFAHDFIMGFELGYDTRVGEHGAQLSGGQRQRIAIARAFLRNAPILLLDEATAALDSESEAEVQKAIQLLQASRTTIVIAHRLQTVVRADKICVVEKGRIQESGRHDELMAKRGRYYNFYQMQFANEGEGDAEANLLSA
ncbi:ABC transporter ATP-binding protein [Xanthobacteraceae bacterium A53D]